MEQNNNISENDVLLTNETNEETENKKNNNKKRIKGIFGVLLLIISTLTKYCGKIVTYTINVLLTIILIGIISGSAMACAMVVYIKNYVDPVFDIEGLQMDSNQTTFIYYQDEKEDGSKEWVEWEDERIHGTENRMWVSYDEMPEDLINAFVSIEDKRFFSHKGVDLKRTMGAIMEFASGNSSYGGSTITQQLIKNVTGDKDATMQRKIQEILRALNLESKRSKEEILENYLNTIYLSKGCYGVSAAAYEFFGKEVSDLTLVECAALASIPQNPSRFDPINHPDQNNERRDIVLNEMYYNADIEKTYTIEEIRAAKEEELVLARGVEEPEFSKVHCWFVDTVIYDIIDDLMATYNYDEQTAKKMLYSGGLQIYTTIDRKLQSKVDAIYANDKNFPSHGTGVKVQSAVTVIDHSTGNIVAIHGGRGEKGPLDFNRATQALRQPGSSIKPISAYSIALDKGLITYSSTLDDSPFRNGWPKNANRRYDGLVTVSTAVKMSKNTIAVKVVDLLGVKTVYDFMVDKYRFTTLESSDMDYAPLGLGGMTRGVTNREMATAYAAIANNGVYNKSKTYTKVLDSVGNIVLDNTYSSSEVILKEDTCAIMTKLMQEVVASGTGASITLKRKIDVAGKTGTTSDNKDLYFCGYTPYYTAAVWVGYDKPKSLRGFTSGQRSRTASIHLWDTVMTAVHEDIIKAGNLKKFSSTVTKNLIKLTYCRDSGLLLGPNCGLDPRGSRAATGYFTKSNRPTGVCNLHTLVSVCTESGFLPNPTCTTVTRALLRYNRKPGSSTADSQYIVSSTVCPITHTPDPTETPEDPTIPPTSSTPPTSSIPPSSSTPPTTTEPPKPSVTPTTTTKAPTTTTKAPTTTTSPPSDTPDNGT